MSFVIYDIVDLYNRVFGAKPRIGKVEHDTTDKGGTASITNTASKSGVQEQFIINTQNQQIRSTATGSILYTQDLKGVEILLPTWLEELPADVGENGKLFLPYAVIRITGSSTIVRTPLAERRGSVKELYNIEDYKISLKGFFIDKEQRTLPEKDLQALKRVHEEGRNFRLNNAITNIFLADEDRVVITGFELPEVTGGRLHARPFIMNLESDSIFTLEVEDNV